MKIMVYEARPDERADLEKQAALHGVELSVTDAVPTLENASLAAGCIGVSILGQGCIDAALLDAYHALGIRYLSTRTIGYDHIDLDHARSIGLRVCSASYAPNGVADFTVMMLLMCLRHYKQALWRGQVNDFSLTGLQGREMKDLTIGIIGTGWIAESHIESYKRMKDVKVVAMADLIPGKAEKFAARYGIENCKFYPDHKSMLDSEKLDAVSVLEIDSFIAIVAAMIYAVLEQWKRKEKKNNEVG